MQVGVVARDLQGDRGRYIRGLAQGLLELRSPDRFHFYYNDPYEMVGNGGSWDGRIGDKRLVGPRWWWDHVALPTIARRDRVDALLCTQGGFPLVSARCPVFPIVHSIESHWDRMWLRVAQKRGAFFIVYSKGPFDQLIGMDVGLDKILWTNIAIDEEVCRVTAQDELDRVVEKYALPGKFILVSAANDNVLKVIRAYATVRRSHGLEWSLVIAGDFGVNREGWQLEIGASGVGRDILGTGDVDEKDWPALYSLADVFVSTDESGSLGFPLLEAMACGCPVVCSPLEYRNVTGVAGERVEPSEVADIARGIKEVLRDSSLRDDMRLRGHERVDECTWNRVAKETMRFLTEVVSR